MTRTVASTEATFTVRRAVEACQVSEKTIRRHLPALAEHGASVDDRGRWTIPWSALMAVGLTPGKPAGPDAGHRDLASDDVTTDIDRDNYSRLLVENARLTSEVELLRDLAATQKQVIALALRQLPPGALDPAEPATSSEPATEATSTDLEAAETNTVTATETAPKRGRLRKFFTGR